MKSDAIVTLFLERKDGFGCARLSVKQTAWLSGQLVREQKINLGQGRHHPLTVQDTNGNFYKFAIYPNGAGFIKPFHGDEPQAQSVDETNAKLLEAVANLRALGHTLAADELEKAMKHA